MKHIIWDWNGTLLNDLAIIIESVNRTVGSVGIPAITLDDYRTHYTRPVKQFYDNIAGYEIDAETWQGIDGLFHANYRNMVSDAQLAAGAEEALRSIDDGPHGQSLLTMASAAELELAFELFDVERFFDVAQANTGPAGGFKSDLLADHLARLDVDPREVTMIGDTVDDGQAALDNEIGCVLYDDGSHHRHDLETVGVPITDSIAKAVEIALR